MDRSNRRQFLRGAGIALTLPWLETLAHKEAKAETPRIQRYVMLYFSNGTADFWRPASAGAGDAWALSPILEPLGKVKRYVSVLTNVSNYAPFGGHVEPSHSNLGAATWTCVKPSGQNNANSGISVDQVIANRIGSATRLPSLQVGLSTLDSYTDGLPGQHSRSMSWSSASQPLYKMVSPQAVFDRLVADSPTGGGMDDAVAARRRALKQSALDYVKDSASDLQKKLSKSDRDRLEQFLTATRSLEKRVADFAPAPVANACAMRSRPTEVYAVGNTGDGYNRGVHSKLMIDLVTMAIRCDMTRVVSFMLDDARSDFVYDFLKERKFTDTGSTEGTGTVGGYHGLQHAGDRNNGFATIGYWNAQQAAELAAALMAIDDGNGSNALDNTVIAFASGMKGGNHDAGELPIALIGGGGKTTSGTLLKTNQHVVFPNETRLADVHLTILQRVFGCPEPSFGASSGVLPALLS
ncbi:MAG TPA: DUF1552 domain-containing protein [Polyangiaceae bacterium]|nr:DUF1552 domain-containing protein [Polyangiaceae bacterium]